MKGSCRELREESGTSSDPRSPKYDLLELRDGRGHY